MAYLPVYLNSKNARGNSWRKKSCGQQLVEVNLLPVFTNRKETRDEKQQTSIYNISYLKTLKQRDLLLCWALLGRWVGFIKHSI